MFSVKFSNAVTSHDYVMFVTTFNISDKDETNYPIIIL